MGSRLFRLCALAALTLLGIGCGHVHTIYYARGVAFDPDASRGLRLDQVYAAPDAARLKGARLAVQFENPARTIQRTQSKISKRLEEGEAWTRLRSYFELINVIALRKNGVFKQVESTDYPLPTFKPDFVLRIAITEWHEGNKWGRAFLGFGVGHTRVQFEGLLTDVQSGKAVIAFADARVHPGGPSFFGPLDKKPWRGDDLIAEDLNYGAKDLARALKIVTATPPPK